MSQDHYDVLVNEQMRRLHVVNATPAPQPPADTDIVTPPAPRSQGKIFGDTFMVFLILLLPVAWMYSWVWFGVLVALVLSIVITTYLHLVNRLAAALGPPDRPQVIAVIKAPERLFCPCCGEEKTDRYCSTCGVNVEKAYRKMVRQLARYVVLDTQSQRDFLETSLEAHLQQVAEQHRQHIEQKLASMERQYSLEIARLRKAGRRSSLPAPPKQFKPRLAEVPLTETSLTEVSHDGAAGQGLGSCTFDE